MGLTIGHIGTKLEGPAKRDGCPKKFCPSTHSDKSCDPDIKSTKCDTQATFVLPDYEYVSDSEYDIKNHHKTCKLSLKSPKTLSVKM